MIQLSIAAPRQMSRGGGEAGLAHRVAGRIPSWERIIDQFLSRLLG